MTPLISIVLKILIGVGAIGGLYWAWRNDYISWGIIRDSLSLDGLKDTVITIFSEPLFILLYVLFVLAPIWVISDWIAFYTIPIWQKIFLSIGGIWAVNRIMIVKGLK